MKYIGDNMIGDNIILKEIELKLKKIAKLNRKKYGHIIDLTDVQSADTKIELGWIRYNNDSKLTVVIFDFISGIIYDYNENEIHLKNLFFKMGQNFEKQMRKQIKTIKNKEKDSILLEEYTTKRLNCIIEDIINGKYDE